MAAAEHDSDYLSAHFHLGLVEMELRQSQTATDRLNAALQPDSGGQAPIPLASPEEKDFRPMAGR